MQMPIGAEGDFNGVVDLVEMRANVLARRDKSARSTTIDEIPADLAEQAAE